MNVVSSMFTNCVFH